MNIGKLSSKITVALLSVLMGCFDDASLENHECSNCLACETCVETGDGVACEVDFTAYTMCGSDGKVHSFDSCDVDEGVYDECNNGICVETSADEAECECINHWDGEECLSCPANWDFEQDCNECLGNYDLSTECISCLVNWDPATGCSQCLGNYDETANCEVCLPNWDVLTLCKTCETNWDIDMDCDDCIGNWDPNQDCVACENHWIDESNDCGTCPGNWNPTADCNLCIGNWDEDQNCEVCSNQWIDEANDCGTCPGNWDPQADCNDCVGNWNPDHDCAVCDGYTPSDTNVCGNGTVEAGEECEDCNTVEWDGCKECEIVEFQVNTSTAYDQQYPDVETSTDGSFVVVWAGDDASGYEDVYGQRFGANGFPVGSEFFVNTETSGGQYEPVVGMAADGSFVVVWTSEYQDGDRTGVYGQRYDANGSAVGSEFLVNTTTDGGQESPSVSMAPDGRFVVVWAHSSSENSWWDLLRGQRFDASGTPQGAEFSVGPSDADYQTYPCVAMADDGSFVTAWIDYRIYAQRFSTTGTALGSAFAVGTGTFEYQNGLDVATNATGAFVVAWHQETEENQGYRTYARPFSNSGTGGSQIVVNSSYTEYSSSLSVSMAASGGFVVAWSEDPDGDGERNVYGEQFTSSGGSTGVEFSLAVFSSDSRTSPVVSTFEDGRFVTVWQSDFQDGDDYGIFAQRYDENANPTGLNP